VCARRTPSYTPGMRSTWIAVAATCAALAACTTSSGDPAPGGTAGPPATASQSAPAPAPVAGTYCAKAPAGVVGSALGVKAGTLKVWLEGPVTVCSYVGQAEVIVRYQVGESATSFAAARSSMPHQRITTMSGLGDDAFFARSATSDTLAARQGTVAVFITSPAALDAERTLMTKLLAAL
jgi:hypothetical protein